MSWVCSICSSHNDDTNATCEVCGESRPAVVEAPKAAPVCTLTQTRAGRECAYADVTVPEEYNVIGENAFKGRTDLYTIRIHSGVKKIMKGAFDGCTNLYSVYVEGELSNIGARAFADCKYLSPERRPTAATVARDAFVGCSPTPIGTPDRSVGARPSPKTGATSPRTGGTKPTGTGTKPSSGISGTDTEFTKTIKKPPAPPPKVTPPPPPVRKTGGASLASTVTDVFNVVQEKFSICFTIAVAAFVAIFLFTDWGLLATREAWQTAGGLTAVFCVGMLVHRLYTESRYVEVGSVLSVMTLLSMLVWMFGGKDTVIISILALGLVILTAVMSYLAFDDVEEECGWWILVLFVINLLNLIFVLVRFNYYTPVGFWQVLVAEAIALIACVFAHNVIDVSDYAPVAAVSVCGFIITACIVWWFGSYLATLASVLSLGLIIIGAVGAYKAFDDYETESGVCCTIFGGLQVLLFVLVHLNLA